jgi:putative phosphoribosyl transferase
MRFVNREEAGRALARELVGRLPPETLVLGLPRGGAVVAAEVARALGLELELLVSRKVGAPGSPELGIGAVAEEGTVWLDHGLIGSLGLSREKVQEAADNASQRVDEQVNAFRGGRNLPSLAGRAVLVVDDGIAMGGTMQAALRFVRRRQARHVAIAVPVASSQAMDELRNEIDEELVLLTTPFLDGIGAWYDDFRQVSDEAVLALMRQHRASMGPVRSVAGGWERLVRIDAAGRTLLGTLDRPDTARGLVLFAHGSGSSRHSPRNHEVARRLNARGLATLLFDLLTDEEEREDRVTSAWRFDVPLLARRLVAAIDWCACRSDFARVPIGLFGASTGAAAALIAAAERPDLVAAVVSRGGRPDLAMARLPEVRAPTLLIVGEHDDEVLALNERAFASLAGPRRLAIVPGATHLFEEPGALDDVMRLAEGWFERHLAGASPAAGPQTPA